MEIRIIKKDNLKEALNLVWESFQEFEAPNYSAEGIEEFKKFISYNSILDNYEKNQISIWGSFDNEVLTGVIATRGNSHICMLFVDAQYHRRGIAKNLFNKILGEISTKEAIEAITVNSSIYAKEVYHRLGFVDTDHEQTVNGIKFIPMTYTIRP